MKPSLFTEPKYAGYNVFGPENGNSCFSSGTAEEDYQRQGPSEVCLAAGTGGVWSLSVYRILMKSE